MSQTTKKALAASLKKLLTKNTLDKITVIDIVEDCEVNRQTFYYHFQDIYDLVDWLFLNEASEAMEGMKSSATWKQGFLRMFEWNLENQSLVINVYHSISREKMERFLYEVTFNLLICVINEKAVGMPVREEDKKFIADIYKFAFVGIVLEWIRLGMKENPHRIMNRFSNLMDGVFERALEKFRTDQPF